MVFLIDLTRIFEEQDRLNKETAAKHEEYSKLSRDQLTRNYVFAALAEAGEMANEWSHFKIWKSTRKENRDAPCQKCNGLGELNCKKCVYCENGRVNPLREEYIDVVHFIISVAIGFDLDSNEYLLENKERPKVEVSPKVAYNLYLELYKYLVYANVLIEELEKFPHTKETNQKERTKVATQLLNVLFDLGYSMGFTDADIERAYFAKNKVNKIRQENNY